MRRNEMEFVATWTTGSDKFRASYENAIDYLHFMNWVVAEEEIDYVSETANLYCLTGEGYVDIIVHHDWFEVR